LKRMSEVQHYNNIVSLFSLFLLYIITCTYIGTNNCDHDHAIILLLLDIRARARALFFISISIFFIIIYKLRVLLNTTCNVVFWPVVIYKPQFQITSRPVCIIYFMTSVQMWSSNKSGRQIIKTLRWSDHRENTNISCPYIYICSVYV